MPPSVASAASRRSLASAPTSGARLLSLLEHDREAAGEARTQRPTPTLATAEYQPTRRARWLKFRMEHAYLWRNAQRYWERRRLWIVLGVPVAVLLCVLAGPAARGLGDVERARASESPKPPQPMQPAPAATAPPVAHAIRRRTEVAPSPARQDPSPNPAAPTPDVPVALDPKVAAWIDELSPHMRVVRADALLRNAHLAPAGRARALIESALSEGIGGAHAQASLAKACLRTGDDACALDAVHEAMRLRPWRGGYRSLERRILDASKDPAR